MMSLYEVSEALKKLPKKKGSTDTLENVARTTGLSRSTIVRMKHGDANVLARNLQLVSDYFEGELDTE